MRITADETPSTSRSGYLLPTASSGAESLRSRKSLHSSTALRPWYSAKGDKNESQLYSNVSEIETDFPKEKYKKILEDHKLKEEDTHFNIYARRIFLVSIKSFLKGEFTMDDLANISEHILCNRGYVTIDELGSALYAASELSFYSRRIYTPNSKNDGGMFFSFMEEVMKYYEKFSRQI